MRWTVGVRVAAVLATTAMQACQQENVTSVVVTRVIVEPAQASVAAGEGLAFTATVVDEQNELLTGADVSWSTEDARVVSIGSDGRAEAVSAGSTRIVAAYHGVTGSACVVVQPPRCEPTAAPGKGKGGEGGKGKGKGKGGGDDDDGDHGHDDDDDDDGDQDEDDEADEDDEEDDEKDDDGGEQSECTPVSGAAADASVSPAILPFRGGG